MGQKRVVIVNAGNRGNLSAEKGSYDLLVEALQGQIDHFEQLGVLSKKTAVVEVVKSLEEVQPILDRIDLLIFITLGLQGEAKRIKNEHPGLKVVVLTALLPKDEIILVDKKWLTPELMENLVFDLL